jgi:hypothetical protein
LDEPWRLFQVPTHASRESVGTNRVTDDSSRDVNPSVRAFATIFLHTTEKALRGDTDLGFLRSAFNKLLLNFTWRLNRKDRFRKNVLEGGCLPSVHAMGRRSGRGGFTWHHRIFT